MDTRAIPTKFMEDEENREFERTICLVKPNAISKSEAIKATIRKSNLMILKTKRTHLKAEQARDFFVRSLDNEFNKYYRMYENLMASEAANQKFLDIRAANVEKTVENSKLEEYVNFMTGGPVEILIVAGRGAVVKLLKLMGSEDPKLARMTNQNSLRAKFGGETVLRNGVYGSANAELAEQEINFFFPSEKKNVQVINRNLGEESSDYLSKTVNPILLKGLIQLCRQKPDNPLVWLADWLLANNPNAKA